MALRIKKDIKKASYYVWFLGAQESRGLRGEEYAIPAIEALERRSRELDPFKVTLQVSHKGLKIIQNVAQKGKQQTIKHFIPHSSITSCVIQGDIVGCVLLLYNPVTRCPIHVHAYRCDSEQTAELLCSHLQSLIEKPENQKKFADIERKLLTKGVLPSSKKHLDSSLGSEVSTRLSESGSSEERCVATLYDSLAAELKQKLSTGKSPILLPPRDYDTVHRQKGNLTKIDTRRCLNQSIVGVNARRKLESSGGSSGIGSDLAPSPDQEYPRQHDNQSTSDEEWGENTAYLMHDAYDVTPQRRAISPRRPAQGLAASHAARYQPSRETTDNSKDYRRRQRDSSNIDRVDDFEVFKYENSPRKSLDRTDASNREFDRKDNIREFERRNFEKRDLGRQSNRFDRRSSDFVGRDEVDRVDKFERRDNNFDRRDSEVERRARRDRYEPTMGKLQRGASEGSLFVDASPKDRFNVAKEKFMNLERIRLNQELEEHVKARRYMLEKQARMDEEDPRDRRSVERQAVSPRRQASSPRRQAASPRRQSPRRYDERRNPSPRKDERIRRMEERRGISPRRPASPRRTDRSESPRRIEERSSGLPRVKPLRRFEFGTDEPRRAREDRREVERLDDDMFESGRFDDDFIDRRRRGQSSYYPGWNGGWRDIDAGKFRHSYAEPISATRIGLAARPY